MLTLDDVQFDYPGTGHAERGFRLSVEGLRIQPGESVAMTGASGVGKTTVLRLAAGILRPVRGRIELAGVDLGPLAESGRRRHRLEKVGFVFQDFRLLDHLNVMQNVLLPFRLGRLPLDADARIQATGLLERLGIATLANRDVRTLSRGEQQRTAICRALVTEPAVILADEPTGDLDRESAVSIMDLMARLNRDLGRTIVMVTHDPKTTEWCDSVLHLEKGRLAEAEGDATTPMASEPDLESEGMR